MTASRAVFAVVRLVAAGLLFWALSGHPIGYYTILRLVISGVCLYAAYIAFEAKQTGWAFVFAGVVILFQPLISLRITRETWRYVDVITALFLLASIVVFRPPTSSSH